MGSDVQAKNSRDLQLEAERITLELLGKLSRHFGTALARPRIRFDLRGKSAGQARTGAAYGCSIRYNVRLLERHPREFLAQTVPHETAHVAAFALFGPRIPPHGPEWRAIMKILGASPERCHSYRVEGLQARHLRRFNYRCACRTHRLTSIRHNRVNSGQIYLCRQCGRPLEPVPSRPGE